MSSNNIKQEQPQQPQQQQPQTQSTPLQTNLLTLDAKTNKSTSNATNTNTINKKDVKQESKGQDLEVQNFFETPDEAQLINTQRSSRTVWLVKAPPFLAAEWNKLYQSGADDVDVGLFTVTQDEKVNYYFI